MMPAIYVGLNFDELVEKDIAGLFKRMSYSDVNIFTLSEGEVLHLCMLA